MKCPKCNYLGFDTGDRCRNCGYDFSFMTGASPAAPDLADMPLHLVSTDAPPVEPALPLFGDPGDEDSDEPLIKLPVAPRPPLAVRRTPDVPRLRAVPRPVRRAEPALQFSDEAETPLPTPPPPRPSRHELVAPGIALPRAAASVPPPIEHAGVGGAGARSTAMLIDHLILFAIDVAVIYFTLRIAGLAMSDWRSLPVAPLTMFLLFLKLGYFCAFTAVGGQTIGKMAAKIRVVTEADEAVDGVRAIQRAAAATLSALVFGLGYVPALIGGEHRALHDRVAHTRVVALRSA